MGPRQKEVQLGHPSVCHSSAAQRTQLVSDYCGDKQQETAERSCQQQRMESKPSPRLGTKRAFTPTLRTVSRGLPEFSRAQAPAWKKQKMFARILEEAHVRGTTAGGHWLGGVVAKLHGSQHMCVTSCPQLRFLQSGDSRPCLGVVEKTK